MEGEREDKTPADRQWAKSVRRFFFNSRHETLPPMEAKLETKQLGL